MTSDRALSAVPWMSGALAIACGELVALGSAAPALMLTTLALLGSLGLAAGAMIAATDRGLGYLGRKYQLGPRAIAAGRALPAAIPLALVSRHLFDGGFASTLPGASLGVVWVPLVGTALLAAGLAMLHPLVSPAAQRIPHRLGLAGVLVLGTIAVELVNHRFFPADYPDVHAFLSVVAIVIAGAAIRLAAWPLLTWAPAPAPMDGGLGRGRAVPLATALLVVLASAGALAFGLRDARERWVVATRGVHTRQLTRVVRQALDFDGDGYASVLGGGDCNDFEAAANPAAVDVPGDGRDQDCDGADTLPALSQAALRQEARALTAQTTEELGRIRDYHIALIVVDALRADVLDPAYKDAYPHLHALAGESRHFRRAFSPASGTDASMAVLFTSRINPFVPVGTTLIEAMAAAGKRTHAVIPREVLRWANQPLITRGLGSYDRLVTDGEIRDVSTASSGYQTTDRAMRFLDKHRDEPTFVWLHYFDVHEHQQIKLSDPRLAAALGADQMPGAPTRADKYRASVRLVDAEIGRYIEYLKKEGLWDRTILVLASDHGESLLEDPRLPETHGRFLYNPLIHVPLLVRVPGVAHAVIDEPVSLMDVAPTLTRLAGAAADAEMAGRDLTAQVLGSGELPPLMPAVIALNESEQYGLIQWPYKLLVRPQDNLIELYDLSRDFGEDRDLTGERPELAQQLNALYKQLPKVVIDRSPEGRRAREALAQKPRPPAAKARP